MSKVLNIMCGNFVLGMPILETVVGGDELQVVRVPADDLRSGLRIMFPPCGDMNVENSKRFYISPFVFS